MKLKFFFRKHPVFTSLELDDYLKGYRTIGQRTRESLLAYHIKTGQIIRVRRGLYVVVPPGDDAESYKIDPFLLAAKLTKDAILAYHTALEFFNRAYSIYEFFSYLTARPLSQVTFDNHTFRGIKFPQSLCRKGKESFEVLTQDRSGLKIRVTSLERTLVDVLDRSDISGSSEEIWRSLESVEFFDLDKVIDYTILLENATTAAKVGFFLDQHRETLMVDDLHLKALHNLRPQQPHYLNRSRRKAAQLVSDWNLVVPKEILERSWEESL